jgi:hypothetical protein
LKDAQDKLTAADTKHQQAQLALKNAEAQRVQMLAEARKALSDAQVQAGPGRGNRNRNQSGAPEGVWFLASQ